MFDFALLLIWLLSEQHRVWVVAVVVAGTYSCDSGLPGETIQLEWSVSMLSCEERSSESL